jgi:hypothetical protein
MAWDRDQLPTRDPGFLRGLSAHHAPTQSESPSTFNFKG